MRVNPDSRDFFLFEILTCAAIFAVMAALVAPYSVLVRNSARSGAISAQVKKAATSAKVYMRDVGLYRVRYSTLIERKVCREPISYWGEKYDGVVFDREGGVVQIKTANGKTVSVKY
ncbi:MAG: hypothetical protein J6P03_05200 [Opitutales bacterium]|nr:hypothetical protein [Opitutales bacterium]